MAVKNFGSYVLEHMNLYLSSNFKNPHDHPDRRQLVYPSFQEFYKTLRSIMEGYFWEKRRRAEDGKIVYVPRTPSPYRAYKAWLTEVMILYDDAWSEHGKAPSLAKVCATLYAAQLTSDECEDQRHIYVRRGKRCLPEKVRG